MWIACECIFKMMNSELFGNELFVNSNAELASAHKIL